MSTIVTARDVIEQNIARVSLPRIALRLNEMVDDPLATAADVGRLLGRDRALTERVLKLVNSSFYGFPARIESLSLAITILGARQLRDLVLATVVTGRFGRDTPLPFELEDFWRHSLCCAVAARAFAKRMRVANRERYFIAGLLHDVGKLVLYPAEPERARELVRQAARSEGNAAELEREVFGVDHMEVGAELVRQWRLPASLAECIALHHSPQRAEHHPREAAVTHMADAVANSVQPGLPGDHDERYDPRAWRRLDMDAEVLEAVPGEVERQLGPVLELLYYDSAA